MILYIKMLMIVIGTALACPEPEIVNHTDTPVPMEHRRAFERTCRVRYKKCVKKIIRKEELNYWVICGGALPK